MSRADLLDRVVRHAQERRASSSAVIVSPGVDIRRFTDVLASRLMAIPLRASVFGPFDSHGMADRMTFRRAFIQWLQEEQLLSESVDMSECLNAASLSLFFGRVSRHLDTSFSGALAIELIHADQDRLGESELFDLFSDLRKLCAEWRDERVAVHFITTGAWSPVRLERVFFDHQTSWPFVTDLNLSYMPDLTVDEATDLLRSEAPRGRTAKAIHGRYLWEMTSGDEWTIQEVLSRLPDDAVTCDKLYSAAASLIQDERFGDELRRRVLQCSSPSRALLAKLLEGYLVDAGKNAELADELRVYGLVKAEAHAGLAYPQIRIKNWVMESAFRYHRSFFEGLVPARLHSGHDEFVPPIQCLNQDAYAYIYEIETLLRNLVIGRLGMRDPSKHPLQNERLGNSSQDEFSRASKWREQVAGSKYVDTNAPLIGFTTTGQLIELVEKLILYKDPLFIALQPLVDQFKGFKEIRNAVAHNQIISEASYDILLSIRAHLYSALSAPSSDG